LELKVKRGEDLAALWDFNDWFAEWKWDDILAHRRGGETLRWSRGDEMITDAFPQKNACRYWLLKYDWLILLA